MAGALSEQSSSVFAHSPSPLIEGKWSITITTQRVESCAFMILTQRSKRVKSYILIPLIS